MSNYLNSIYTEVNNLSNIFASNIDCDSFLGQSSSYFTGITNNIQTQINAINSAVSSNIPTFSIGTVSSGYVPSVSITGTQTNPILNFQLVPGLNGANGAKGDKGEKGDRGEKGDTGDPGNAMSIVSLIVGLADAMAVIASAIFTQAEFVAVQTQLTAVEEDITVLNGKTFCQNYTGSATTFSSTVDIGTVLYPTRIVLDSNGNITANGDINIYNYSGSNTIALSHTGEISAGSVNCQTGTFSVLNVGSGSSGTQSIDGNIINIGHLTTTSYSNINMYGVPYINGVPLLPWSSATSFFSQW